MKVLITLGPTQEPIDDVRFITNASSGRMGAALAEEALKRGHKVIIVAGPVNINLPKKARVVHVRTAAEMTDKTLKLLEGQGILISTAAIADYTPDKKISGKIKSGGNMVLKLKRTRKLIKEARKRFPDLFIVGFKAEYGVRKKQLAATAKRKLIESRLDLIVANDLSKGIFDSDETEAFIIEAKNVREVGRTSKAAAAGRIWDAVESKLNP